MKDKILTGLCIFMLITLFLFGNSLYRNYYRDKARDLCNELEEFPEQCYSEGIVSYPKERKGEVTCICIEYGFLGEEYEYLEVNQKNGKL